MASPYDWSPESVGYARQYGGGLMKSGSDASPVGHWTQALARVLQGGVGGYMVGQANEGERAGKQHVADTYKAGLEQNLPMNKLAATLMGNPFGAEQGQALAKQHMVTAQSQGFQTEQQKRQFDQQREMARLNHQLTMAQNAPSLAIQQDAQRRANEMHTPELEAKRLALEKAKADSANPVTSVDLGPDHARVLFNRNTGQEVGRIGGPPKGPDSTTRKAIYESQDELPNINATIESLNEAKSLLPKIYTGFGSNVRTSVNQGLPGFLPNVISDPNRAKATQRFNQIMNAEAISAMSQTLKGASTDREMAMFVSIINDPNVAPDVKTKAIDQMIRKAEIQRQVKTDRITELGGKVPQSAPAPSQVQPPPAAVGGPQPTAAPPAVKPLILPNGQQVVLPPGQSALVYAQTPADAAALPSGTVFLTPDGKVKVKP